MYCVFVCCNLTAAGAVPFRYLLSGAGVVLVALTGNDFVERRGDVKPNCVRSVANSAQNLPNACQYASISYETLGVGDVFSGEDFQNIGTFIVVRSSVFSKSSAHKTHLARDAEQRIFSKSGTLSSSVFSVVVWEIPAQRSLAFRKPFLGLFRFLLNCQGLMVIPQHDPQFKPIATLTQLFSPLAHI